MVLLGFREQPYEIIAPIGAGGSAQVLLVRNRRTEYYYAMKCISRGSRYVIDGRVEREILNHRSLRHPNVIQFVKLVLIGNHLGIVMEYAKGGSLSDKIFDGPRLSEDQARKYFHQVICGVSYCHAKGVCHRDLKPGNILCHGNRLKICDFGLSKSSELHSTPHSVVGTPFYMAPEVFAHAEYDGKSADVWSCGCILYAMLTANHAFPDSSDLRNEGKTFERINVALELIPAHVSQECKDLLRCIFVINPGERITIEEIKKNQWFLKDLPDELKEAGSYGRKVGSFQSEEEIKQIIEEAKREVSVLQEEDDSDEDIFNPVEYDTSL